MASSPGDMVDLKPRFLKSVLKRDSNQRLILSHQNQDRLLHAKLPRL